MYRKNPKQVNTKFVLGELNKIKKVIRELDDKTDLLYASTLFEEVKDLIKDFKTITTEKIQRKFQIGYVRTSYLIEMLEKEGYVKKDKENTEHKVYIVNKKVLEK